MPLDPYAVLGLARGASLDDIKKAYRRLSKELHPDRHRGAQNKDAEKRFKDVNEAYEILSDPKKKESYDRFGFTGGAGGGGFRGSPFEGFSAEGFGDVKDIFEQFFGGGRRASSRGRGEDREVEVQVSFMESAEGIDKSINIHRIVSCEKCSGSGGTKGANMIACSTCGGTGQIRRIATSFFGEISESVICDDCRGSGRVPSERCSACRGEGRCQSRQKETIHIPAGIADGQTIRLRGHGDAGWRGEASGDLFVLVRVMPDSRFTRDGNDVHSIAHISLVVALLGGESAIDTVHGTTTLSIPSGTQSHQVFRIRNKGIPVIGTSRNGDHYVTVIVDIPTKLSRREKELIEEWRSMQ